ncbi:class I SAM-dependent methyltransferase [Spirulina sp. 06S082]|uniref:class I SAM-dependent methyltransferase n=1 Tax=Spirulina sp. 06S082 TaxID=3110248 RepID=UPI002B20A74C|nr:class I SAM-dependent methyltransferase [Spirulina sp. 06S082]MEA5470679.1 class I SAM-dependent methyltransferase [Spirulina sp. 06S082]
MTLIQFKLPPRGVFQKMGESDPLDYYYKPLIGKLYVERINGALSLLENRQYHKILEIGYGSGILMPTLCRIGQEVYGVDLDSDPRIVTEKLKPLNCHPILSKGITDCLVFDKSSFDLVVAISVLEHIKEIEDFMQEISRIIQPGGFLLVGMPRVDKAMNYLFKAIGFSVIEDHHVTTPEDMLIASSSCFEQIAQSQLPNFLPSSIYLYKSFLLRKK